MRPGVVKAFRRSHDIGDSLYKDMLNHWSSVQQRYEGSRHEITSVPRPTSYGDRGPSSGDEQSGCDPGPQSVHMGRDTGCADWGHHSRSWHHEHALYTAHTVRRHG